VGSRFVLFKGAHQNGHFCRNQQVRPEAVKFFVGPPGANQSGRFSERSLHF
jgi:hypothetical protein